MKLNQFLGAFRNPLEIMEGINNRIFKKEHVEAEAALRWAICKKCPHLDNVGNNCLVPGTQPCCSKCGCSLSLKTRSLSSDCPDNRWKALLTEEQEDLLNEQIENGTNI